MYVAYGRNSVAREICLPSFNLAWAFDTADDARHVLEIARTQPVTCWGVLIA